MRSFVQALMLVAVVRGQEYVPPLAVVGEQPRMEGRALANVPILAVPSHHLPLIPHPLLTRYSPSSPFVTCQQDRYTTLEAMPAVRVELAEPLLMEGAGASVPFPDRLAVSYQGLRLSLPVAALLAPVHEPAYAAPHVITVLYAVPAYHPYLPHYYPAPYPFFQHHFTPVESVAEVERPSPAEEVSGEEELTNRGPPAPALEQFVNSKESPLLQAFREEALRNKEKAKPGVEAL